MQNKQNEHLIKSFDDVSFQKLKNDKDDNEIEEDIETNADNDFTVDDLQI